MTGRKSIYANKAAAAEWGGGMKWEGGIEIDVRDVNWLMHSSVAFTLISRRYLCRHQ